MKRWPHSAWAHAGISLLGATLLAPIFGILTYFLFQAVVTSNGHLDSEGWGKLGSILWGLWVTAGSWVIGLIVLFVLQRRWAARRKAELGINTVR
jgi:hypothetical protein